MSRPFLKPEEKKDKLGITISKELNAKLGIMTNNKSKFIENLISEYLKSITVNKELKANWSNGEYIGHTEIKTINKNEK